LLKDLSAEATEAGIVNKIRKLTQIFGKDFPVYIDKDCLINLKKHSVKTISAENFTQIGFRDFGKNYQEEPSCLVLPTCLRKNINQFKV